MKSQRSPSSQTIPQSYSRPTSPLQHQRKSSNIDFLFKNIDNFVQYLRVEDQTPNELYNLQQTNNNKYKGVGVRNKSQKQGSYAQNYLIKKQLSKRPIPKRIQSFYQGTTKRQVKAHCEQVLSPHRNMISPQNIYAQSKNIEIMSQKQKVYDKVYIKSPKSRPQQPLEETIKVQDLYETFDKDIDHPNLSKNIIIENDTHQLQELNQPLSQQNFLSTTCGSNCLSPTSIGSIKDSMFKTIQFQPQNQQFTHIVEQEKNQPQIKFSFNNGQQVNFSPTFQSLRGSEKQSFDFQSIPHQDKQPLPKFDLQFRNQKTWLQQQEDQLMKMRNLFDQTQLQINDILNSRSGSQSNSPFYQTPGNKSPTDFSSTLQSLYSFDNQGKITDFIINSPKLETLPSEESPLVKKDQKYKRNKVKFQEDNNKLDLSLFISKTQCNEK